MNIAQMVKTYAASPSNPPKGYGSIDKGIEVIRFRGVRMDHYRGLGFAYEDCAKLTNADVIKQYGEPFVSYDEDGIPI